MTPTPLLAPPQAKILGLYSAPQAKILGLYSAPQAKILGLYSAPQAKNLGLYSAPQAKILVGVRWAPPLPRTMCPPPPYNVGWAAGKGGTGSTPPLVINIITAKQCVIAQSRTPGR